jgi:hypothetical protein
MEEHKTIQKIMAAQGTVEEGTDGDGTSRWAWAGEREGTGRNGTGLQSDELFGLLLLLLLLFDYCFLVERTSPLGMMDGCLMCVFGHGIELWVRYPGNGFDTYVKVIAIRVHSRG